MITPGETRRVDAEPGELRSYGNEYGLGILAAAVKILTSKEVTVDGVPIQAVIAGEVSHNTGSSETYNWVLGYLDGLSMPLANAVRIEYIRPESAALEDSVSGNEALKDDSAA